MAKTPAEREAQLDAIEARLRVPIWAAVREWLAALADRLLGGLTAAAGDGGEEGVPPDPAMASRLRGLWLDILAGRVTPALAEIIRGVVAEELRGTGIPVESERAAQERFVQEMTQGLINLPEDAFRRLQDDLLAGIDAGDGAAEMRDRMAATLSTSLGGSENSWRDVAMRYARTLSTRALNGGLQQAWGQRNAVAGTSTFKQWIATLDERTRPTHVAADGQVVAFDARFTVGGAQMAYPGDPAGGPSETENCRCVMGEVAGPDAATVDDRQLTGDYGPIPGGDDGGDDGGDALTAAPQTPAASAAGLPGPAAPGVVRDRDAVALTAGGDTTMSKKAQTWSGLLAPFGVNSGDRRRLAANGTFTHRDLPLPLMFQQQTGMGHDNSVVVGRILTVEIRMTPGEDGSPAGYYGTGDYLVGEEFAEDVAKAVALAQQGLGHVSVDLADVVGEMVDADGNPVTEEDFLRAWESGEDLEVYDQFTEANLIGVTQVPKPAFAEALINLDGAAPVERTPDAAAAERALAEAAADVLKDSAGTEIEVGDQVTVVLSTEAQSDDAAEEAPDGGDQAAEAAKAADPDDDGDNDSDPAEDPDGDGLTGTVTAVDVDKDEVTVQPDDPDEQPVVVASADVTVTEKAAEGDDVSPADPDSDGGGVPPSPASVEEQAAEVIAAAEAITVDAAAQVESLRATAGPATEFRPDAECFANPQLAALTPLTIGPADAAGIRRVFGHVAGWKTCHIGYSQCVTPPKEDDFAFFHVGAVELADGGELAVGNLTLGGRHADPKVAFREATEHYDDSGAGVAVVRAYADEFGIAIAGVITPETTDAQLAQMRRSPLSGDWRRIGGEMRLVGALAVNTGGFPIPRYAVDDTGRLLSLVAAGSVPQAVKVEESYEDVARRVFAEERQKENRREEVAALVASATAIANRTALDDLLAGIDL